MVQRIEGRFDPSPAQVKIVPVTMYIDGMHVVIGEATLEIDGSFSAAIKDEYFDLFSFVQTPFSLVSPDNELQIQPFPEDKRE